MSSRSRVGAKPRSVGSRKTSGVSESCLQRWLKIVDVEDGITPGVTQADAAELREARKRIRLLEQANEILRRAAAYLSQASLPK